MPQQTFTTKHDRREKLTRLHALAIPRATRILRLGLGWLALGWMVAIPVFADSTTANVTVSVTVVAHCALTNDTLHFGDEAIFGTQPPLTSGAAGTIRGSCSQGALATISLDQGTYAAPGSTAMAPLRRMQNAQGAFLTYYLYQDEALKTVWGDSTSARIYRAGRSTATDFTIYGRLAAGREAEAGSYHDTVVVTITY